MRCHQEQGVHTRGGVGAEAARVRRDWLARFRRERRVLARVRRARWRLEQAETDHTHRVRRPHDRPQKLKVNVRHGELVDEDHAVAMRLSLTLDNVKIVRLGE